jgi:hypothetical protein
MYITKVLQTLKTPVKTIIEDIYTDEKFYKLVKDLNKNLVTLTMNEANETGQKDTKQKEIKNTCSNK